MNDGVQFYFIFSSSPTILHSRAQKNAPQESTLYCSAYQSLFGERAVSLDSVLEVAPNSLLPKSWLANATSLNLFMSVLYAEVS